MDIIEDAMLFARAVFSEDFSGHDYYHTLRVFHMATRIAQEENANLQIVQLAALLHDVDDRKLSSETCEYKTRAVAFLKKHTVPEEQINEICEIISQISFSSNSGAPKTLEGKCVQDADRLDAIGAIGIARAFAYGGNRCRMLHDPNGTTSFTTVDHFYDKLLKLKDLMNTNTGRRIARGRDTFMRSFLDQFYSEWDGIQ